MFPLGCSFILGSASLERANRQGLPKAGWTDELAHNIGTRFSGTSLAQVTKWTGQNLQNWRDQGVASLVKQGVELASFSTRSETPRQISLRRRQRRAIAPEITKLSQQLHQRLDEAIAVQASHQITPISSTANSAPPFPSLNWSLAPDLRQQQQAISTLPLAQRYSPSEVANFIAIALGTEFSPNGQTTGIPHIRKWTQDLRIQVHGQPTPTDIATLELVVAEINVLLGEVELGFVESEPNLEIFFVAERNFSQYEASYQPVNHGFFWNEAAQGKIQRGRILISTTDINQTERSHLIREELTQSLGLMQDSLTDANSIFFQGWSQTQAYSLQDQQLLKMLYRPEIHPGMDAIAVQRALLGN